MSKSVGEQVGQRDFNRTTLRSLKAKGIEIYGATWLPGKDGSFANGERGYQLSFKGCSLIRTFREVLDIASNECECLDGCHECGHSPEDYI